MCDGQLNRIIVSVVIVNFNGIHLLEDCLRSIDTHLEQPNEIIIVDNGSTDGSCEEIRNCYPRTRLIESNINLGFAGGCNLGATIAKGEYILLLNSDARLCGGMKPGIKMFEADPRIGIVGGRLYYGDGRLQYSMGYELTPSRILLSWMGLAYLGKIFRISDLLFYVELNPLKYESAQQEMMWVSGALMLIRKSAWEAVGGMPDYFMYVEDCDFCKSIRSKNFRVVYSAEISAVHLEGGGKPWIGRFALLTTMDSYLTYFGKYYTPVVDHAVCYALSGIMLSRSLAFRCLEFFGYSFGNEKADAYWSASVKLLFRQKKGK